MTAYRDRMLAGEYDEKTDSKAKAAKKASVRAAKSTTSGKGKRSGK